MLRFIGTVFVVVAFVLGCATSEPKPDSSPKDVEPTLEDAGTPEDASEDSSIED